MAIVYWTGQAGVQAQTSFATFATYDVSTTRNVLIGGFNISAVDSGGSLTAALATLAVKLNGALYSELEARIHISRR